ncbi:uncharacterized protein LOC120700671 [Panicum virgatum]|uniref:uncharacterized protein LOC120700671 n=1 Tax=Panicum virgatum TaxID=38727 RepID=UPI0019D65B3D|nr:uncharacterized protein LOC120700671 [Panicum virgatum]
MEVRSSSGNEPRVVRLPGDLVTEIVARVPYRSLCRFKLVSRSWRALCSDPAVRRWCPQTLAGFFFRIMPLGPSSPYVRHFVNSSGEARPWSTPPSRSCRPATGTRASSTPTTVSSCTNVRMCARTSDPAILSATVTEEWIDLPGTKATCISPSSVWASIQPCESDRVL